MRTLLLAAVLALSLLLNLWGNGWGVPAEWHPDEITTRAMQMATSVSLNPHNFAYGGLHHTVLALGAAAPVYGLGVALDPPPPKTDEAGRAAWFTERRAWIMRLARTISGVLATGTVLLTAAIATVLFDPVVGVVAALVLAVAPSSVAIAHFATVDAAANFWFTLAAFWAVLAWRRERVSYARLAALTAGLAIGTKIDRVVVLIPLLVAAAFRPAARPWYVRLGAALALVATGYVIANPALVVAPFEFIDGTLRELFLIVLREEPEQSHLATLGQLAHGLGWPLAALVGVGIVAALGVAARRGTWRPTLWVLSAVVPYLALFGERLIPPWYAPFFYPPLAVLAAVGVCALVREAPRPVAAVVAVGAAGAVAHAALLAVTLDLQFVHDSRVTAGRWIAEHVPDGATLEIGPRGPYVPPDRYAVARVEAESGPYDFVRQWNAKLERNRPYHALRGALLAVETRVQRALGRDEARGEYTAWFDVRMAKLRRADAAPQAEPSRAAWIVIVDNGQQPARLASLRAAADHELAAAFAYEPPGPVRGDFLFVNPPVMIFKRAAAP